MNVVVLFNEPSLPADDPNYAQEAGVLESVEAISAALKAAGHRVQSVSVRPDLAALWQLLAEPRRPDVVVNLCEGFFGTGAGEACVAGLMELFGVPFTGCPADCLALVRDKARTKWLLQGAGLPTPAFHYLAPDDPLPRAALTSLLEMGPAIVKPAHEDASLGIDQESVVTVLAALEHRVQWVRSHYGEALVEAYIEGREFNAAMVTLPEPRMLPLSEIEFIGAAAHGWRLVTYDAKWTPSNPVYHDTPGRCPAEVDAALGAKLERVALDAYRITGCRGCVRVDMRVDGAGQPYVLEVNANPDLSPIAGFARAVRASGMTYDQFVVQMVEQTVGQAFQPD